MTIASEITKLNTNLTNSYTAVSNKGGTLPASENFDNLPTAINSITELAGETRTEELTSYQGNTFTPTSGKNGITSITVTPKNRAITLTPSTRQQEKGLASSYLNGYSGYGKITVNAVTSAIDSNIQAGNIKKDVSILGVTGTYEGSGGGGSTWQVVEGIITGSDLDFVSFYNPNSEYPTSGNFIYLVFDNGTLLFATPAYKRSNGTLISTGVLVLEDADCYAKCYTPDEISILDEYGLLGIKGYDELGNEIDGGVTIEWTDPTA